MDKGRRTFVAAAAFAAMLGTASVDASDAASDAARAEFARAFAATATDNASSTDSAALRGYILYPYLEQARLMRKLAAAKQDFVALDRGIQTFLTAHDGEVAGAELRRAWYADLAKRQEWERLFANYRDVGDPIIRCHALTARLMLQRFDNLQSDAVAMWSSAPESRPACEPVFNWLRSQSALSDALIETRTRLALSAGNTAFARQLIAMLPKESAELLQTWASLIERPRAAIDAAIATPKKVIEPAALLDGWTRFVRADALGATSKYKALVAARGLPPETASRFALELALALSWNRRPEALDYFARVRPADIDDRAAEWHARAALWAGNWKRAATVIEAMSNTLRQQTKWRYWEARIAERRGNQDTARARYAELIDDDNYYAALSAARLKKPYAPRPRPLPKNEEQLQTLAVLPPFARARELLLIDSSELRAYAYDEWRKGYATLDAGIRVQAIQLAAQWGWHDQAILTASQQNQFDDYPLLYPRPFDADVHGAAEAVQLPTALVYAMLRQESLYRVDAQSSAGAKGLMQLIPDTAKRTARRWPQLASAVRDPKDLLNSTTSIYLGSAMLRELIERFDGNTPAALAAYNAGPGAVDRWRPTTSVDIDVWIENIPYNETRVYVQRILWHSVVFGWLATGTEQNTTYWLDGIRLAAK